MTDSLNEIIGWSFPLLYLALMILALTRSKFPGQPWLIGYLGINAAIMITWRVPQLFIEFGSLDFDISKFYDLYALPLNIINIVATCLLFPFLFAIANGNASIRESRDRQ